MDRARRAEPYSNATIWTREIARNLAGHLSRVSKAHSCVDTKSPKSTRLPQFHHQYAQKRCPTSPVKTRQALATLIRNTGGEGELDFRGLCGGSAREEIDASQIRKLRADCSEEVNGKGVIGGKKMKKKSVQPRPENTSLKGDAEPNQDTPEKSNHSLVDKISGKQQTTSGLNGTTMYDSPLHLPLQRHRLAHDYYRRQEQLKIWQENQALIKRLQNTKATLNSKQWERDGKWTQDFLRNQERRRSVLQQEMRKAQASPQAMLRAKPLKVLHPHHLKRINHDSHSDKTLLSSSSQATPLYKGTLSAREHKRSGPNGEILTRRVSDTFTEQATAANHRRILELRKQKPLDIESDIVKQLSAHEDGTSSAEPPSPFIPDNEIVSVRFTFSRGRSRGSEENTQCNQEMESMGRLDINADDKDMMSLSGAFSPGIELESALNATAETSEAPTQVVFNDQAIKERNIESVGACPSIYSVVNEPNEPKHESSSIQDDHVALHIGPEDIIAFADVTNTAEDMSFPMIDSQQVGKLADNTSVSKDHEQSAGEQLIPTPPSEPEGQLSIPRDLSVQSAEVEDYGGDDFDFCPSARDASKSEDEDEASGYGSEFEEDVGASTAPNTEANDNQPKDDADVSYSHDEFVDPGGN